MNFLKSVMYLFVNKCAAQTSEIKINVSCKHMYLAVVFLIFHILFPYPFLISFSFSIVFTPVAFAETDEQNICVQAFMCVLAGWGSLGRQSLPTTSI